MKARRITMLLVGVAALLLAVRGCSRGRGEVGCPGEGTALRVDTERHVLVACCDGRVEERFVVRLGSRGVGKRLEGDKKTPLGTYPLSPPRSSPTFGTFVPIGYPTPQQQAAGYTGSAVGVHGPHRRMRWAGPLTNLFDTTDGCVGLATDGEMERLAGWMKTHGPTSITLD